VSYDALIAAQAKRLTKKRERKMGWHNDWFGHPDDYIPSPRIPPSNLLAKDWQDGSRTYADLYVPPAPERVELSHTEWADGYKRWRDAHKIPSYIGVFGLDPEWHERVEQGKAYRRLRCFAENEI
jgi:hypothetical protein